MHSHSSANSLHIAGSDSTHFNSVARCTRKQRPELYGSNDIAVGQPNLLHMPAAQLVYPLYTVQVYLCLTSQDLLHASYLAQLSFDQHLLHLLLLNVQNIGTSK